MALMTIDAKYLCDDAGELLKLNQLVRHNHEECGDTRKRLYIKKVKKGYLAHCHNCAPLYSGFMPNKDKLTMKEIAQLINSSPNVTQIQGNPYIFPSDFCSELPHLWSQWLAQCGITAAEAGHFGIGWSPTTKRLIMPVYDEHDAIVSWTERVSPNDEWLKKGVPKYIQKARIIKDEKDHLHAQFAKTDYVVLVEDYLSTVKVSRLANVICLCGSYMPSYLIPIIRQYERVIVWLDEDKEAEGRLLAQRLNRIGMKAHHISTRRDPKYISEVEMRHLLTKGANQ